MDFQQAIENQERLLWATDRLRGMLALGVTVGFVIMLLQIATLLSKWYIRKEAVAYFKRSMEHLEESWQILQVVKEWASSARIHHKETEVVVGQVAGITKEAVDTAAEKTRKVVVESAKKTTAAIENAVEKTVESLKDSGQQSK